MTAVAVATLAILVGWRFPSVYVPCMFFGFTAGAITQAPQLTSALAAAIFVILFLRTLGSGINIRITLVDLAFAAYVMFVLISSTWAVHDASEFDAIAFAISTISVYLIFRTSTSIVAENGNILGVITVGFIMLAILFIPTAYHYGNFVYGRLFVHGSPPVALSQPLPYVLISSAYVLLYVPQKNVALTGLAAVAAVLAIAMIAATGSRGALIAAVFGILTLLLLLRPPVPRLVGWFVVSAMSFWIVNAVSEFLLIDQSLTQRLANFASYGSDGDLSSAARYQSYRAAWSMFENSPFFGGGVGSFEAKSGYLYPHNMVLELLAETGIAGLFLFGLVAVAAIRRLSAIARFHSRGEVSVLSAMLVAGVVHQQFSFELAQAKGLLLVGLVAGWKLGEWPSAPAGRCTRS